ncbi:hypothetical protein CRENBAI_008721 [Crenichthys baileyi]|uniref:Uncharacterized protein n=1 Tax=Crenichthys baileyi TaxID=28760 RepID=A0AAV9RMX2_9TELE
MAACLPEICPQVLDVQGRFVCKVLVYILTQIHVQNLKNMVKEEGPCISGIDKTSFSDMDVNKGNEVAHEMIVLCSTCRVPSQNQGTRDKSYKLCTYKTMTQQGAGYSRTCSSASCKKASVTVSLEVVYDMLALCVGTCTLASGSKSQRPCCMHTRAGGSRSGTPSLDSVRTK